MTNKNYLTLGLLLALGAAPITAMATEQTAFDELVDLFENSEKVDVKLRFSSLKLRGFHRIALYGTCYWDRSPDKPSDSIVIIKKKPCRQKLFGSNREDYCPKPFVEGNLLHDGRTFKYIRHEGVDFLLEKIARDSGEV